MSEFTALILAETEENERRPKIGQNNRQGGNPSLKNGVCAFWLAEGQRASRMESQSAGKNWFSLNRFDKYIYIYVSSIFVHLLTF